jgi:hypothetical protein
MLSNKYFRSVSERVEIYDIVESWIDTFFTGWKSEHGVDHQTATAVAKIAEISDQRPSKSEGLHLNAKSNTISPTSSVAPSMYKLQKHTTVV